MPRNLSSTDLLLADAIPSEASTLWFLVISSFVQLACGLAVRMLVPMSVGLGLLTKQELVEDVGVQVCNNLRIAKGLNPVSWLGVLENFENGYSVECSCVPEKAEQQFDDELEMVGSTPQDVAYGTRKQATAPRKKVGHIFKGDIGKASQSWSKRQRQQEC